MRAWLVIALAVGVFAVSLPVAPVARAQDTVEAPEILVEEERVEEAREEQVYEDRPVETEVVRAKTIQKLPVTNAADLARHLAGVRTQSRVQGEEAVVSIEGLPPEYTRVLVNGQRYSGSIGGADDLRDVPVHALDLVEVKRGTQGVRQGGEGAGGVLNFVTRTPPDAGVRGRFDGGLGDQGKILAQGASEFRAGPVGITLSAVRDQIDGFDPRGDAVFSTGGGKGSRRTSHDLYGTASWSPLEKLETHARLGWRREDENFVDFLDAPWAPGDPHRQKHPDPERRDSERWVTTNGFAWSMSEATRFTGDLTWYGGSLDSDVGRPFTQDEAEWRLDLAGEHFLATGPLYHALTLGFDGRHPSLDLDEGPLPLGVPDDLVASGPVDEQFRIGALFLEDEIALHDRVSLLAGIRLEEHSEFGFDWMPQVALLGKPHESLALRASWGTNRRAPTLKDLHQPAVPQLDNAYFLAGNPDLEPEQSTSWRIGAEWTPRAWVTASVVGYWNEIEDAIRSIRARDLNLVSGYQEVALRPCPPRCGTVLQPILTPAPLFVRENLDQLRTRGVEADLRVRPHPRVETRLAYTYLQTKVEDSNLVDLDELPNSPHHVVDATVGLRLPVTETSVALTGRWRSPALVESSGTGSLSFTDATTESDTSLILDMRVTQPVREGVDLYVDFQNLLDEESVDSYAIRGFSFFVGVRADWTWKGRARP